MQKAVVENSSISIDDLLTNALQVSAWPAPAEREFRIKINYLLNNALQPCFRAGLFKSVRGNAFSAQLLPLFVLSK
jgi:hypothetical protein